MKKRVCFAFITTLFLVGCTNQGVSSKSSTSDLSSKSLISSIASSEEKEWKLKDDTNENYVFDNVSNKNGSMSYEIFVRSFYDSNNDGVGDFIGIKNKMSYLADLGIKTVWLMPIHNSPSYHGYDVSDFYSVNSDYGTMNDFTSLINEANKYNIDIMIDFVINHTSDQNQWFKDSYNDYKNNNTSSSSKKDWYNWSTTSQDGYSKYGNYYYESRFSSSMPDLNFDSSSLKNEIEKVVKFWIDKGVKGFRLDAVLYYYYMNSTKNVSVLTWLEETAHKYDPSFYMVGEAWSSNDTILEYYDSKCDSFFKFKSSFDGTSTDAIPQVVYGNVSTKQFLGRIATFEGLVKDANPNGYSSYFLSNHDQDRSSANFTEDQAKLASSIYCLLPGTPFMYYGEEIQLKGKRKDGDNSDSRRRLPMIWSESSKTGQCSFPEPSRPDLSDNDQVKKGVEDQLKTPYSLLNHYKKVINVRNKYDLFKKGKFTSAYNALETENESILAYKISLGDDYIFVVTNCSEEEVEVKALGSSILDQINTKRKIPEIRNGILRIGGYSTVIIK